MLHSFYSDNEIITVNGRPAIFTLIVWILGFEPEYKKIIFIWRQKNDTLVKDSQFNIIENIFKLNCEDK